LELFFLKCLDELSSAIILTWNFVGRKIYITDLINLILNPVQVVCLFFYVYPDEMFEEFISTDFKPSFIGSVIISTYLLQLFLVRFGRSGVCPKDCILSQLAVAHSFAF
jgi:hypothetical protein